MFFTQSTAIMEADKAFGAQNDYNIRYEELLSYVRSLKKKIARTPAGSYRDELTQELNTAKKDLHWLMISL